MLEMGILALFDRGSALVFVKVTFGWVRGDRSCDAKPLKHTPLFGEEILCLAWIMGETGESGPIPRFAGFAIACIISVFLNGFQVEN
jgi:hypothetical protein